MKIYTSTTLKQWVAVVVGVAVAVLVLGGFSGALGQGSEVTEQSVDRSKRVSLSTSSIPVRVSGVVEAAQSTIVYAQTAGVVTDLLVREGGEVAAGTVLVRQALPVAEARLVFSAAERELSGLEQSLQTELRSGGALQAEHRSRSAADIASLRAVSTDTRVTEAVTALTTTAAESTLSIIGSINYINNHRYLFSATGLELYEAVVADLYGSVPDYFQSGVVNGNAGVVDLQSVLQAVQTTEDPVALETFTFLLEGQLAALTALYETAESDVFDRQASYVDSALQSEYLTMRESVLLTAAALQTSRTAYQQELDGVLEDEVLQNTTVTVSAIDAELASLQAQYAARLAAQSDRVAAAGVAVVAAELSLGRLTAPFSGVVSKVFVDEGEYVVPGTPLLSLVGAGAREFEATVPAYLLPHVAVGQAFVVDSVVMGYVDRFSTISTGGSGTVIIALSGDGLPLVGSSLTGSLLVSAQDGVYRVPRSHVHYDADGLYVQYVDGTSARAQVLYDAGQELFITVTKMNTASLVPAVSIAL